LEAGGRSIPVVSTTSGAEGIPVTNGKDILIADSSTDFAESIIRLIKDKDFSREIAGNLHKLVQTGYGLEALQDEAKSIVSFLR